MKLKLYARAALGLPLILLALVMTFSTVRALYSAATGLFVIQSFLLLLAGVSALTFIGFTLSNLIDDKRISKVTFLTCVIFSVIVACVLLYFAFGYIQDMLGIYCTSLFNIKATCTAWPFFLSSYVIFHPYTSMVIGLAALPSLISRFKKSSKSKPKE